MRNNYRQNGAPIILNVAEKPSVARALAGVFSRLEGAQDKGMRREANQVFTHENVHFPSVMAQHQRHQQNHHPQNRSNANRGAVTPHTMITTSVRGHLASQDFPAEYGWSKCDPSTLFDAPLEISYRDDMQQLQQMLSRLARQCAIVILWLDCDREGEAIGDEVRTVCCEARPGLPVLRARFSTVLPGEIKQALSRLDVLNEHMVAAVQARSELDLRVGAAFTRFQTLRLQRKFEGLDGVLSYGPCQFPTLGFVVERWARIETFVPEDFWYIELGIRLDDDETQMNDTAGNNTRQNQQNGRPVMFKWKRGKLYDQLAATILYESCLEAGECVVTQMNGRPKNKWRPVPLATVELQKRASRYLRIGSEQLMSAAEELYNAGFISYPRTETEKFRPEFQHRPLIQQCSALPGELGAYAAKLLQDNNFQNPRAGQHDDQAHPPITPAKLVDPSTIQNPVQRQIYSLVLKHYLACCSRDAIGRETTLTVQMDGEQFTATGLMVLERNWLEIYSPWERWGGGQGELPPVQVGSRLTPASLVLRDGRTGPPRPITEVELISLMDRNGIGTDATIAQHISTIQDREYSTKDGNQQFLPTPLGIALVEGYNSMGYQLNKPDLRRETESECNHVAAGRKSKEQIMTPILAKMRECYQTATNEAGKLDQAVGRHLSRLGTNNANLQVLTANFSECGNCQQQMTLKQERQARGQNGRNANRRKLLYCEPCSMGYSLPRGQPLPKTQQENGGPAVKCPICQFQVVRMNRGDGYEGNGYHICPKCFSNPPVEHGGSNNGAEFRCFSCQHPTCTLASGTPGGDVQVFNCPFCHPNRTPPSSTSGKVCLRKNSRGYVLSCNKYVAGQDRCPYTIWLPKEAQSITVDGGDENQNNTCPQCLTRGQSVRSITFVWKPGSVPPHMGRECTVCVLCDVEFRREMRISLPRLDQVQARPRNGAAGRGRGQAGRGANRGGRDFSRGGQGGGGGHSCYKCGQPGHFANNCPN